MREISYLFAQKSAPFAASLMKLRNLLPASTDCLASRSPKPGNNASITRKGCCPTCSLIGTVVVGLLAAGPAAAVNVLWTNANGDNKWSTGSSWSATQFGNPWNNPDNGITVEFGAAGKPQSGTVIADSNGGSPTTGAILFDTAGWLVTGAATNHLYSYGITSSGAGTNTIQLGYWATSWGSALFTTNSGNTLAIQGNIVNGGSGSGIGVLTKSGAGTLALSGANSYTGVTTIQAGVLEATTLANGGSNSSIGASSNAAANLVFGAPTATLRYTGASNVTTNRGFTFSNGSGGGATIESSGTGTLTIDNTIAIAYGTAAQTRVLTLGGTNTGANTFGKVLANNGGALTSLTKSGTGAWTLTANNSYTGGTTISGGKLTVGHLSALGSGTVNVTGGELALGSFSVGNAITLNGGKITGSGVSLSNLTVGSDSAMAGTFSGTLNTGTNASRQINTTGGASFANVTGQATFTGGLVTITGAHNPGNSPGTQTFTSGLTYANDSVVTTMELAGIGGVQGVDSDDINVTGTITLNGILNIVSYNGYDLAQNAAYDLFDATTFAGHFDSVSVGGFSLATFADNIWSGTSGTRTYSFNETNGILTVVPEPTVTLLGGLGLLALLRRRK